MNLIDDLRIAWRALRAQPTFFAAAVLTLMLGIGAVTAIFTVYDAVLLKPLPFSDADRIVRVMRSQPPVAYSPVSPPILREWVERSSSAFAAFGAYVPQTLNLTGGGDAERLSGYRITPGYWDVFGQPIALGRAFGTAEENANERVVVLGDAVWRDRFGASPDVIGRDVDLNGERWRVIGVAKPGFRYPADAQLWLPAFLPADQAERGSNSYAPVARLADGVSLDQARDVMDGITSWQAETFPEPSAGLRAQIMPLRELIGSRLRTPLAVLLVAAGLVLLIACANLASLMLARGQARAQELALRSALGAGRGRLLSQVLAESLLIAAAGAAAALLVAPPAVRALLALAPGIVPAYHTPAVDLRVVVVTAVIALSTLLLFGLVPAWRSAAADPLQALAGATRSQTGTRRQTRARGALVAAEIALATTLLAGAGLLIDSLRRLDAVDTGIADAAQILGAGLSLSVPSMQPGEDFATWYPKAKAAVSTRLTAIDARLRALPGVESVALTNVLPVSGEIGWNGGFDIAGRELPENRLVQFRFVSTDYFSTFGIPLRAGRVFDAADGTRAAFPIEAIVNQTFVDRYLGGGDALGLTVSTFDGSGKTIVGVVADVRQGGPDQAADAEIYFPASTVPVGDITVAIKGSGDVLALAPALRSALREVAPEAPLFAVRTMDEVTRETTRLRRFNMSLMSAFAAVAVLLASIGLYGVIAYTVGQRRREIGVRQSLGATALDIHRLTLGAGLRMIVPGLVLGLAGALALGRVLSAQLYGVGGADPFVLVATLALLAVVGLAACAVPSLRAARVSPLEALRDE